MKTHETNETNQYLTFSLDGEIFALDIAKVREVLDCSEITRVPKAPKYICGVINLRGSLVPVMDLRTKFDMAKAETTDNSCIIITEIEIDDEIIILGALADSVKEVLSLDSESIEASPRLGARMRSEFIKGMGKPAGKFIIILDIDKTFSFEDFSVAGSTLISNVSGVAA